MMIIIDIGMDGPLGIFPTTNNPSTTRTTAADAATAVATAITPTTRTVPSSSTYHLPSSSSTITTPFTSKNTMFPPPATHHNPSSSTTQPPSSSQTIDRPILPLFLLKIIIINQHHDLIHPISNNKTTISLNYISIISKRPMHIVQPVQSVLQNLTANHFTTVRSAPVQNNYPIGSSPKPIYTCRHAANRLSALSVAVLSASCLSHH